MNPRAKKIIRNIIFLLSIPLIIGAFVFANKISNKQICQGFNVRILNPEISFVVKDDIINAIQEFGITSNKTLIKDIQIKNLERRLEENKWISDATVFTAANGIMNATVMQKEPVVRIQQRDSSDYSYYLDQFANPIEWSDKYSPRLLVATSPRLAYTKADLELKTRLVNTAQFISKDTFWNNFVTQLDINERNEIDLIPALGNHTIQIGDATNLQDKMGRLLAFYQQGMYSVKWNDFDEIDTRFNGQIVCRNTSGMVLSENPYGSKELMEMKVADKEKKLGKQTNSNPIQIQKGNSSPTTKLISKPTQSTSNKTKSPTPKVISTQSPKPMQSIFTSKPTKEITTKATLLKEQNKSKEKVKKKEEKTKPSKLKIEKTEKN